MATNTAAKTEAPAYLNMSDEELMNATLPDEDTVSADEDKEEVVDASDDASDDQEDAVEDTEDDAESDDQEDSDDVEDEKEEEEEKEESSNSEEEKKEVEEKPAASKETKVDGGKKEEKEPVNQEIDYKAEYSKIFAPFKANGKEVVVSSAEDAISLMQMGAGYNKRMQALKPNLKLMKMLDNSGLLSEEKISYLIDLDRKNPEAISKLIKDGGLDPMDLDADKASGYKPNTYTVDEREIELDTVLEELQGTPAYTRTLDVVSTKWDGPSKQVVASTPQLLRVINDHIESGIYDIISKEVERERMFGRLKGLSDIDAYRQVGDELHKQGGFNHLSTQVKTPVKTVVTPPKPDKAKEDELREKRRAASSTRSVGTKSAPKEFNPLSMSDDEFDKIINTKFA